MRFGAALGGCIALWRGPYRISSTSDEESGESTSAGSCALGIDAPWRYRFEHFDHTIDALKQQAVHLGEVSRKDIRTLGFYYDGCLLNPYCLQPIGELLLSPLGRLLFTNVADK